MALRMLTYVGLLYQDLVRSHQLSARGKLPPILPLVLYNGARRWNARRDVSELIEPLPEELQRYCPRLQYLLLDEGALPRSTLPRMKNLAAALFRLERSRQPDEMRQVIGQLRRWLQAPKHQSLRRAFTVWIRRVLLPERFPEVAIPETGDLLEIESMLRERVIEWTREWEQNGIRKGLQQGRQEGRQEGKAELVCRLLARRFSPLDPAAVERVRNASPEQLEIWSERLLDAVSLEEVFRDQ